MKNVPAGQNKGMVGGKNHGMGLGEARGVQHTPVPTQGNGSCLKGTNHGNRVYKTPAGKNSLKHSGKSSQKY